MNLFLVSNQPSSQLFINIITFQSLHPIASWLIHYYPNSNLQSFLMAFHLIQSQNLNYFLHIYYSSYFFPCVLISISNILCLHIYKAINYPQRELTFKYKFHKEDHYKFLNQILFHQAISFHFQDSRKYKIDQRIKHQI